MKRKWFRRNWPKFLEYGLGLPLAFGVFYVFVTFYDDWLAFSAFATLLLALAAFLAIRHSSEQEKRNRKERLLNEIIEWAIDISKCGEEKEFKEVTGITDTDKSDQFVAAFFHEVGFSFQATRGKSEYIVNIAPKFGKDLQDAVEELTEAVEVHIDLLHKIKVDAPGGLDSAIKEVGAHNTPLAESGYKVIKEATKIKTRGIGQEEDMSKESENVVSDKPTLKDIEEHLKRQDRQMQWPWLFSLGVSAMAIGLTWVIATTPRTPGDLRTGLFVFSIGLVISLLSLFYRYRKKS